MNWGKILGTAGLVAAIFAAAPAAQAQTTATASLNGFTFSLLDLDLTDGITPSITLSNQNNWIATAAYPDNSGYPSLIQIIDHPGTASISLPGGPATASYGNASGATSLTVNGAGPRVSSDVIVQWDFVLSAHTSITLTGQGSVNNGNSNGLQSWAQIFSAYRVAPTDQYETYLSDDLNSADGNGARGMSLTFNSGDAELNGRLGLYVNSQGQGQGLPVPEPESYAMFLAGLAVIGGIVKRRQRAAQA